MKTAHPVTTVDGDAELAARLRLAVNRLARRLRHQGETGISPSQLSALATVDRSGPMTLGDLAAVEQVRPPSMTRIVSRLEGGGLVDRQASEQDRRVARVRVTAAGRQLLQRSRTRKDAYLARRLQTLDAADRALMGEAVAVLERILERGE
ncbi:MAG TPA: MarR family transcriptional regulator [Acidimicrobiales bacterium]|jgi:DNA-binding MarR family transcriptional regulator|nr:MarR family transcriptional regulator [Acidimicrobiales bacterium]